MWMDSSARCSAMTMRSSRSRSTVALASETAPSWRCRSAASSTMRLSASWTARRHAPGLVGERLPQGLGAGEGLPRRWSAPPAGRGGRRRRRRAPPRPGGRPGWPRRPCPRWPPGRAGSGWSRRRFASRRMRTTRACASRALPSISRRRMAWRACLRRDWSVSDERRSASSARARPSSASRSLAWVADAPRGQAGDARRLLEDGPALGRPGVDDGGDAALGHDAGRARARAAVLEQDEQVAVAHVGSVEAVLAAALAPGDAARHLEHVRPVEVDGGGAGPVVQGHRRPRRRCGRDGGRCPRR